MNVNLKGVMFLNVKNQGDVNGHFHDPNFWCMKTPSGVHDPFLHSLATKFWEVKSEVDVDGLGPIRMG